MTFDELLRWVLDILPNAEIHEDESGELVIATGLVATGDGDAPIVSIQEL